MTTQRKSPKPNSFNPLNVLRLVAVNSGLKLAQVDARLARLSEAELNKVTELSMASCRFAQVAKLGGDFVIGYQDSADTYMRLALNYVGVEFDAGQPARQP